MTARILIVIPTLGARQAFLHQALHSLRSQSVAADIIVISPESINVQNLAREFDAEWCQDPGKGLPAAINSAIAQGCTSHEYVSWLGDDDLLEKDSLAVTSQLLDGDPKAVLAFGSCRYIDDAGRTLWINASGRWAVPVLSWGPQLIPQPGMLIRASAWQAIGGLDTSYRMAFDFDLLLRLKKTGELINVNQVVSCFRWHSDSLTVENRTRNLEESELAKRKALSPVARRVSWIWEPPVRWATRMAVFYVARKAQRAAGQGAQR